MISHTVVSVHAATLDVADEVLTPLRATLSSGERRRADALGGEPRRRFIADHGLRRRLLGRALGIDPAAVEYVTDPDGKPRLAEPGPRFSASRAGDVALYAVCDTAEVGVDVEEVFTDEDPRSLAARLMSAAEHEAWDTLPSADRPRALTVCWARKEAHGKALGSGLVFPLTRVRAWAGDDRPVRCDDVEIHPVDLTAAGLPDGGAPPRVGAVAVALTPGVSARVNYDI